MTIYCIEKYLTGRWLGAPVCGSSKDGAIELIGRGRGRYRIRRIDSGTKTRPARSRIVASLVRS